MSTFIWVCAVLWLLVALACLSVFSEEHIVPNTTEQVKVDAALLLICLLWPFTLVLVYNRKPRKETQDDHIPEKRS